MAPNAPAGGGGVRPIVIQNHPSDSPLISRTLSLANAGSRANVPPSSHCWAAPGPSAGPKAATPSPPPLPLQAFWARGAHLPSWARERFLPAPGQCCHRDNGDRGAAWYPERLGSSRTCGGECDLQGDGTPVHSRVPLPKLSQGV